MIFLEKSYEDVRYIIRKLHIKIAFLNIEDNGYAIVENNLIVIKNTISEEKKLMVILHELGHFIHKEDVALYCRTYAAHQKAEHNANYYMIECLLEWYVSVSGMDMKDINYCNFAKMFNLNMENVKYVIENCI